MTRVEWLALGVANGWCSPVVCYIHDGVPMSDEEEEFYRAEGQVCVPVIRIYEDGEPPK